MKYKKIMIILITSIFLVSIASVCAADANGTTVASEDTSQIELSDNNKIIEDNRQTSGEKLGLSVDDESLSAQTDTNVLGDSPATYSDLAREINAPGTVILKNKSYTYDDGAPAITISEANKVIDGNGAVIDMTESTIRAFTVSASGVTIKNLTIKNANYNGDGGAIYFSSSGTVTNCNFAGNNATGDGGAVYFNHDGTVTNCNFTDNSGDWGGAIYFMNQGTVTNCNFTGNTAYGDGGAIWMYSGSVENCNFTGNTASGDGGAIWMYSGSVENCNFTDNSAEYGGAIRFNGEGTVSNCNFTGNTASGDGGAIWMYSGSVENCNFTGNTAIYGGAVYFYEYGTVTNCNFANNNATGTNSLGGAIMFVSDGTVTNCNFANNNATGTNSRGGAIMFVSDGTVTNCNFTDNSAEYGGAIRFNGEGTVSNCNFTNNSANKGGAVCLDNGDVTNCNFINNSAVHGGAVYFNKGGTVTNCNFTDNEAYNAGAVWIYSGTVTNCNFTNNKATGDYNHGGAVYFVNEGTVTNCNFTNNQATGTNSWGGAIMFLGTGNVTNCNFAGNNATGDGGAIWMYSGSVENCNFTGNTASGDGGAIRISSGTVTNCNFTNNTAKRGNAIYINNKCTISDCDFTNNPITKGAIHSVTGDITFSNNIINVDDVVSDKNFTEIQKLIDRANDGDEITINGLYAGFGIPIRITKSLTLNGQNNTTLDAKKLSKILYITANNVIIKNIQFTSGYAEYGGAIYFSSTGTVTNCNFTNNTATYEGGAVYFNSNGEVTNCNFTNNTAGSNGGAIYFDNTGTVTNCNLTGNTAIYGGAVYFLNNGEVTNCNFTNNSASYGGAVYFLDTGDVTNCNFTNNTATSQGGAVYFLNTGNVSNCNFTDNSASYGGAVYFEVDGTVTNCNFTNNQATGTDSWGGAIIFVGTGNVTNCNFTNNQATGTNSRGGANWFVSTGTVSNCNFANNRANIGEDIYSNQQYSTADTCIFKTGSDTTYQVNILPPTLNVDNFTTVYSSGDKLTFDLKTNSGKQVNNGNISISVYYKNNNSWFGDYSCLSGKGWTVNLPVGFYYAIFNTEYAEFKPINRTITVIPNIPYYANVTSISTNNKTVNITAKSNIPQDIVQGKLLFILPNSTQINANYAGNGTWWAVHTFDDYAVYQVNASYEGLNNVTVINAKITINKVDSTITLDNITLNYGESRNVTVATQGATGITADINGINATVINNYTIQIADLAAGNYTLTVTTIPDGDHNPVTATSKITVNKIESTLTVNDIKLDYGDSINVTVTALGATGITAKIDNVNVTVKAYIIPISGLDVGTYTLTVTTMPDANHNPVTRNATVTVNRAKTELTADAIITTYSVSKNLVITLKDSNDRPLSGLNITVDFNGTKNYTTDNKGQVKISTIGLVPNIYTAKIAFEGNANYIASNTTATITVNKDSTSLGANSVTTTYNINKDLVITLTDSQNNPIKGANVTVALNGIETFTTDANGQIKITTGRLVPKTYAVKITFNGNDNYLKSTKEVKVTVKKLTPKLTAKKKTFKKAKKVKKYTVKLKDNTGKAMKKMKLTLKVKGKTYKAKTNAKGKAVFKIKNLKKKGKYRATVKFAGNNYYSKITKKVKITVK